MSTNFTLAAQCQLKRDEIHELLNLSSAAKRELEAEKHLNNDKNINTTNTNTTTGMRRSIHDMLPQWCMLLTAAQVCSLMQHTLVRVSIPKNKQALLIHGNKYMRLSSSPEKQKEQQEEEQQKQKQSYYRIGKIVAVLPRPRTKSEISTTTSSVDPTVGEHLSDWLLQINFGEVTDLIGAKYVSNESFTAEEHTVFLRSCLTTQTHTTTSAITAMDAEMIARNVEYIRRFTAEVVGERNSTHSTEQTTGVSSTTNPHDNNIAGGGSRKRPRDEVNAVGEGLNDDESTVDDNDNDDNNNKNNNNNNNDAAYGGQSTVVSNEVLKEMQQQLRGLRELLNSKNDDMQRVLLATRQAEVAHNAEKEQYHAKVVSLGEALRSAEREQAALHEQRQQDKEKTNMLTVQLKRIVEHTQKFKQVSDTAAEWLHSNTKEPEEVLRRLNEKIAEMKS
ncbi:uncharacterized protein TM35_000312050 [Trypanosoma theileri]|uniref:Uncharacterized protein n=1 Tax=Trypanosoma theileri TaxID=67003 RepID=A0A1X0NPB5_9TRYP|nr:uncharacterized protein TM35_000312050 [Trypanosoma theileri]ORC86019.1 hypothetical protein TM35_000312050 [Trypanosoma theileri]